MPFLQRLEPFQYRILLVSLLLLSVISPLSAETSFAQTVHFVLIQIALLASVLAARKYRRMFWGAVVLGVLAFSNNSLQFASDATQIQFSAIVVTTMFFALLGTIFLIDILGSEIINPDHLCGAVCVYLILGIIWTHLYALILIADPEAIRFPEGQPAIPHASGTLTYFSFVTLTTLGYGDIQPVSPLARTVCWLEAVIGQIYVTVLVAHLVGLQLANRSQSRDSPTNSKEE